MKAYLSFMVGGALVQVEVGISNSGPGPFRTESKWFGWYRGDGSGITAAQAVAQAQEALDKIHEAHPGIGGPQILDVPKWAL